MNKQNKISVLVQFISIFVIDMAILIPAIARLKFMQTYNELSVFGAHNGLMQTTIKSLITSFYFHQQDFPITFKILQMSVVTIFVLGCIWFVRNLFLKDYNNFTRLFFIFCLCLLAPILQELIFDIPYPTGRTAILYFPLFSLVLIFLFSELFSASKNIFFKVSLITLLVGTSSFFVYAAYVKRNFTNTTEWFYDKYDKEMLELINKDRITSKSPDSVLISNYWSFTPVINFYRVTKNYSWLKPVIKEEFKKADYYICYYDNVSKIPSDSLVLIAKYDDIAVAVYKEFNP
jgi:hypothetical protein